jgi:hypothetical protein
LSEVETSSGPGGEESRGGRLLRLAVSCPRCGSRPALRLTASAAGVLQSHAQGTRLGTYQCQRRGCGAIYDLTSAECLADE